MAYIVWLDGEISASKAVAVGVRAQAQARTVDGVAWPMQRRPVSDLLMYTSGG